MRNEARGRGATVFLVPRAAILLRAVCVLRRGLLAPWLILTSLAVLPGCGPRAVRDGVDLADPAPPELQALPGYRSERIPEPVFGGEVFLLEVGPTEPTDVAAPPLLLIHGLGDMGVRDWFPVLPRLARARRVVAFDLPGFGRSTHGTARYDPGSYVRVIREVLRPRLGEAPFDLAGHSLGGALALAYAARHPADVRRLILVDAAAILYRDAYVQVPLATGFDQLARVSNPLADVARTATGLLTQPVMDRTPEPRAVLDDPRLREQLLGSAGKIAALAAILEDFGPAIAAVQAPTLLVWGRQDTIAPVRTGRLLEARLAHARLVLLDRSAHEPMHTEPDALAELIETELTAPATGAAAVRPAPEPPPGAPDRLIRCQDERGLELSGVFGTLELQRCLDATLRHVTARQLILTDSTAILESSRITSPDVALRVRASRVEVTGTDLIGQLALETDGSELDLAGVLLQGTQAAIRATSPTRLVCSVSRLDSPHGQRALHGPHHLNGGEEL